MKEKKFMVTFPDERIYIHITNSITRNHGFNIREACQELLLDYFYDPHSKAMIDAILFKRAQMRKNTNGIITANVGGF